MSGYLLARREVAASSREERDMDPKNTAAALDMGFETEEEAAPTATFQSGIFPTAAALALNPSTEAEGEGALGVETAEGVDGEEAVTREQRRSRRKRDVRARTISVKRMTKRELELGRLLYPDVDGAERPKTRAECIGHDRPCPFVSCKHHLYLDVSARTGAIKLNFPDLEVWEMNETCALDVSDKGGTTLEEVGAIMNLTRERIRQVEVKGLAKLQALKDMSALRDYVDEGPVGKRRLPVIAAPVEDDEDEDEDENETVEAAAKAAEPAVETEDFDAAEFASDSLDAE